MFGVRIGLVDFFIPEGNAQAIGTDVPTPSVSPMIGSVEGEFRVCQSGRELEFSTDLLGNPAIIAENDVDD